MNNFIASRLSSAWKYQYSVSLTSIPYFTRHLTCQSIHCKPPFPWLSQHPKLNILLNISSFLRSSQNQHKFHFTLQKWKATIIEKILGKIPKFYFNSTFLPSPVSMLSFKSESLRVYDLWGIQHWTGGKGNRQTKASTCESNKCADVFISYPLSVALLSNLPKTFFRWL